MNTDEGFSGAIGNTPLIKLNPLSKLNQCDILVKAEFMNPGVSLKDRTAFCNVVVDAHLNRAVTGVLAVTATGCADQQKSVSTSDD